MDRSQISAARHWARDLADRRRFRPATEPVNLDELVSPLRYDIMVRAQFFDYLSENGDRYDSDFDRFAAEATATAYYMWFAKVALARYRPRQAADPALVVVEFRQRLRRSMRLLRSFTTAGFDVRYPISVRTAVPGARSGTGKPVERSYYAGDGCHRLALLIRSGEKTLSPLHYRVRRDPERTIIDNTNLLIRKLELTPEEYYRFLSRGYADRSFADAPSLLGHVAQYTPSRLAELHAVIAVDEGAFVRRSQGSTVGRVE